MGQQGLIRRRFTLGDIGVLIACTGMGLWLGRSYLFNDQLTFSGSGVARTWAIWAQAAWLVLVPVQLGLLGLSLIPPRQRLRRLARQPGFLAGVAVATAVTLNVVQAAMGINRFVPSGANMGAWRLHISLVAISSPFRVAPAIFLAWVIVGLQGGCRRSHDWIETSARLLGAVWIIAWCTYMIIDTLR